MDMRPQEPAEECRVLGGLGEKLSHLYSENNGQF